MTRPYPSIRIHHGDSLLVREGLRICFYMRRPHAEVAPNVLEALRIYRQAIGAEALGRYADDEGAWRELDAAGWQHIQHTLLTMSAPIVLLHDAEDGQYRYRFEYFGRPLHHSDLGEQPGAVAAACFWLPTEYLEEHGPRHVRDLALKLGASLPFDSGHAGLAFNGELDVAGVMPRIHEVCFRHPGIDIVELDRISLHLGTRVRGPAWLTFLGPPVLERLGGLRKLRDRLHAPGSTVEDVGDGRAAVTLGPGPEAGDVQQGRTLPAWRELARMLEPWLFHQKRGVLGFTPDEALRWERRFLD